MAMITAVVSARGSVEALGVTLSALVAGVADGLIGDAVIVSPVSAPAIDRVADAVGAVLIVTGDNPWRRGAEKARRDWILCLDAGDVPSEGWLRTLERFMARCPPDRRFGRLKRRPAGPVERLTAYLSREVRAGDLIHRALLTAKGPLVRPIRLSGVLDRDILTG
jgi:hypothetical protein